MYRSSLLGCVLGLVFSFFGLLRYDWDDLGLLYSPLTTDTKFGRLVWRGFFLTFCDSLCILGFGGSFWRTNE